MLIHKIKKYPKGLVIKLTSVKILTFNKIKVLFPLVDGERNCKKINKVSSTALQLIIICSFGK